MALSKASAERLHEEALARVGTTCKVCGTNEHLHLHHVTYAPDSVLSTAKGQWATVCRRREAILHPERFMSLCRQCHLAVESMINRMEDLSSSESSTIADVALLTANNKRAA